MGWTNLKLEDYWNGRWPESVDVISPDCELHVTYVPLTPWDGDRYHCIHCGAELHGYQRRCSCGKRVWGYEDNGARAVLDAAGIGIEVWASESEHAIASAMGDADLAAENAKLRELTKDMFACISHANEQDWFHFMQDEAGCGMSCTVNGEGCGLLVLADRMRELGVEVSDG